VDEDAEASFARSAEEMKFTSCQAPNVDPFCEEVTHFVGKPGAEHRVRCRPAVEGTRAALRSGRHRRLLDVRAAVRRFAAVTNGDYDAIREMAALGASVRL
jgi:hypothetical protein